MFVTASGHLNLNPKGGFLRNKQKNSNVKNCSIDIGHDTGVFYRHLVFRKMNIILDTPPTPPHITIIKDESFDEQQMFLWKFLKAKKINFEYGVEIETTKNKKYNRYWYLPVICPEADEIRNTLRLPKIHFHLTFGIQKFSSIEERNSSPVSF